MLGIIGAMDVEVAAIKAQVTAPTVSRFAGIEFVCGRLGGVLACVAQCSPGKVNAALCTQIMIDKFAPERIINVGVACSLSKQVAIKNIVIAEEVCQYDFDTSAVDGIKGLVLNGTVKIAADKALSDGLARAAIESGERIHRGCIASGDTFIADPALKQQIVEDFGAICGEMEGGAIGQVCLLNEVPFAVLRSISDGGDDNVQMDYPTFKNIAAAISSRIILKYIETQRNQLEFGIRN